MQSLSPYKFYSVLSVCVNAKRETGSAAPSKAGKPLNELGRWDGFQPQSWAGRGTGRPGVNSEGMTLGNAWFLGFLSLHPPQLRTI